MSASERLALHTADGVVLEGEIARARDEGVAVVLCHPHPRYGGTMRSLVISALFESLPARGSTCLRFNFRGVDASAGSWSGGADEPLDVVAAIDALASELAPGAPIALVGWSFGADMALAVDDSRVAGWVGIAPPLRFRDAFVAGPDSRPVHLVLAQHDEIRAPQEVEAATASWVATTSEVIGGASHFFVGRTDRVVDATAAFLASLGGGTR